MNTLGRQGKLTSVNSRISGFSSDTYYQAVLPALITDTNAYVYTTYFSLDTPADTPAGTYLIGATASLRFNDYDIYKRIQILIIDSITSESLLYSNLKYEFAYNVFCFFGSKIVSVPGGVVNVDLQIRCKDVYFTLFNSVIYMVKVNL
jgi:hypothetical protein